MFVNIPDNIEEFDPIFEAFEKWELETRPNHATIQTIMEIPLGESRVFLCLDRNVSEFISETIGENKPGDTLVPSQFFKTQTHIKFTKTGDGIEGTYIIADDLETIDYPYDDAVNDFDIEYKPNNWYPLCDGVFEGPDGKAVIYKGSYKIDKPKKHWTSFDKNTRIGWRGPMIPIEKIDDKLFKL